MKDKGRGLKGHDLRIIGTIRGGVGAGPGVAMAEDIEDLEARGRVFDSATWGKSISRICLRMQPGEIITCM